MKPDRLLSEIQRVLEGQRDPATVKRRLSTIVNAPGAAETLARVLQTGDVVDAQLASLALPYATSELVRRGLQRDARRSSGGRRALLLSSLTDEELTDVLSSVSEGADDWLLDAMALFAINDPADFVEMLSESVPVVGVQLVEHIEKVRAAYAISASAVYGPLLGRKLTREARSRVVAILGHEPSDEARALLEREQSRAVADDEKRFLRRERMRQNTLALQGVTVAPPSGIALLSPVGPRDTAALEILEDVGEGRGVATMVIVAMSSAADTFSRPLEVSVEEARQAAAPDVVELSLGQARWLIESLPTKRRTRLKAIVERLSTTPSVPIERPAPTQHLTDDEARALAEDPAFVRWRPLATGVGWPDAALEQPPTTEPFPVPLAQLKARAREELARCLQVNKTRESFSSGLRHMALWMSLRGDPRAGAVAHEALQVVQRRPGLLSEAIAERDLLLQRWSLGQLPSGFREALRVAVRNELAADEVGWEQVALLDLAQAAAEGIARAAGFAQRASKLEVPAASDLQTAIAVAQRAQLSLRDKPLRQTLRAGRLAALADEAREWLEGAPIEAAFQLVQFVSSTCLDGCRYDCLRRIPSESAASIYNGPCPRPDAAS